MKKILALALLALVATSYAQDPQLTATASAPAVQQELSSPDGVAITRDADGSWKIFARGTATYDFNDPDEIRDAAALAQQRAKAALSKFLKESITSSDAVDRISKKTKNVSSDGKTQQATVKKEDVTVMTESIRSYSEAILTGVIVLSQEKVPHGSGGEIQVTIGQSSKTLAAAKAARQGMEASLNDDAPAATPVAPAPDKANNYNIRRSNSDF